MVVLFSGRVAAVYPNVTSPSLSPPSDTLSRFGQQRGVVHLRGKSSLITVQTGETSDRRWF